MQVAITVWMSVRPPAKFTQKKQIGVSVSRFKMYVKEAKVPELEWQLWS